MSELFFLISYFHKIKYEIIDKTKEIKNSKLIVNLKKSSICLIFFNIGMIRFNLLSPIELKIFFDKNKLLINIMNLILFIYSICYFFYWGFAFYNSRKMTKKKHYIKLK